MSESIRIDEPHLRKCWDCGTTNEHQSRIVPGVLCPKCGSQDTRAVKAKPTVVDESKKTGDVTMCYVAADPKQPGAAWAISVDCPEMAERNKSNFEYWLHEGATVMRVDLETGKKMVSRWVRPI